MAIKKTSLNIARVAQEASETFVAPQPLPSNEATRSEIVRKAATQKQPLKRVCSIQKIGGFSFFTTEEDRIALDYISFLNKYEKQNVVRVALHKFLEEHYVEGVGLDEEARQMILEYEKTIYHYAKKR